MAKVTNKMTLKEATEFLRGTEFSYSLAALKAAAKNGKMKVQKVAAPLPYYLVNEADLLSWAADETQHRPGPRKSE